MLNKLYLILNLILFLPNDALADLQNKTYISAKQAYINQQWPAAFDQLKIYKSQDSAFLNQNPSILNAINDAINYCNSKIPKYSPPGNITLVAGGIVAAGAPPAPQPSLPDARPENYGPPPVLLPPPPRMPSGTPMQACGCWGPTPGIAPEARCQSGGVNAVPCGGTCPGGGLVYGWMCQ